MILFDKITNLLSDTMSRVSNIRNTVNKQEKEIQQTITEIDQSKKEIAESKKQIEEQSKEIIEHKRIFSKQNKTTIELLGIFVAIFTFISVEITILKEAQGIFQLLGLSLIFISSIGILLLFIFFISDTLYNQEKLDIRRRKTLKWIVVFIATTLISGVAFSAIGNNQIHLNINLNHLNIKLQDLDAKTTNTP